MSMVDYQEITDYYVSEFERYTKGIQAGTLPAGVVIDRIDPRCRVMRSDLAARFGNVDWTEAQPWIDKAIRICKRRKLWK